MLPSLLATTLAALIAAAPPAPGGAPLLLPSVIDSGRAVRFDAGDPGMVADLMVELGYAVERETAEDPPALFAEHEGLNFGVWFYGCRSGTRCEEVILDAVFETEEALSLRRINEWNRDALMGRVYLDDFDDAIIEHHLVVQGGVERANFAALIAMWGDAMLDFADHIHR